MIKANELRIGNWVINDDSSTSERGKLIEVNTIGEYGINFEEKEEYGLIYRCYFDDLKPIPLTEEWLIRFGAKESVYTSWVSLSNLKAELHFEIYGNEIVTTIKSDFCDLILDRLKFVHQLQNLYFSLTNEKLTLQPTISSKT